MGGLLRPVIAPGTGRVRLVGDRNCIVLNTIYTKYRRAMRMSQTTVQKVGNKQPNWYLCLPQKILMR